jgi:hypothetical protein
LALALREEYTFIPRMFGNKVLWRILGPKGAEVTGGWRKLNNDALKTRLLNQKGYDAACTREKRSTYKIYLKA